MVALVAERKVSEFSEWLRAMMARRGLSARQIAVMTGIANSTISMWLKDATVPDRPTIRRFADGMGMSYEVVRQVVEGEITADEAVAADRALQVDDPQKMGGLRMIVRLSASTIEFLAGLGLDLERRARIVWLEDDTSKNEAGAEAPSAADEHRHPEEPESDAERRA